MKNKLLNAIFLLIVTMNYAQNKKRISENVLPLSLYTLQVQNTNLDATQILNKKLNLKHMYFTQINYNDINDNFFSISSVNLKRKNPSFIYDEYREIYRKLELTKYFFKGFDLRKQPWIKIK